MDAEVEIQEQHLVCENKRTIPDIVENTFESKKIETLSNETSKVQSVPVCDQSTVCDKYIQNDVVIDDYQKDNDSDFQFSRNTRETTKRTFTSDPSEDIEQSGQWKRCKSESGSSISYETESSEDIKSSSSQCENKTLEEENCNKHKLSTSFQTLSQSGLLDLTVKTAQLLRDQKILNNEIACHKSMAQSLIRQVLDNPENAQLKEMLVTLKKEFCSKTTAQ